MSRFCLLSLAVGLCALLSAAARADTFQLNDGSTVSGEIIPPVTGEGLNIRLGEDQYQRVPWTSFAQSTLQELAKNPKLAPFAEPYLEVPEAEKIKKTEIVIREVPRLARPPQGSLLGAFFNSSVGLFTLLALFAANIYAAYEIANFRGRPVVLVCASSAVLPVIGPLVFLLAPTLSANRRAEEDYEEEIIEPEPAAPSAATAADSTKERAAGGLSVARAPAAKEEPVQSQSYQRGQFTFNRRFFETKFPAFFGIIRRDAAKDAVLVVKSARGEYTAERITRISANDMHVEFHRGGASQEVLIPFSEIKEVRFTSRKARP